MIPWGLDDPGLYKAFEDWFPRPFRTKNKTKNRNIHTRTRRSQAAYRSISNTYPKGHTRPRNKYPEKLKKEKEVLEGRGKNGSDQTRSISRYISKKSATRTQGLKCPQRNTGLLGTHALKGLKSPQRDGINADKYSQKSLEEKKKRKKRQKIL